MKEIITEWRKFIALNEKLMLKPGPNGWDLYGKLVAQAYADAPDYDERAVKQFKALVPFVENMFNQIPDKSEPYNIHLMNLYLKSLMQKHLTDQEYEVLRLSYGLDDDKKSAKEIADILNIDGASNYVRISELKKQAVNKLIDNVDHSQVLDYL